METHIVVEMADFLELFPVCFVVLDVDGHEGDEEQADEEQDT